MKEFWNTVQMVFAAIGGWLGYFLGGCDGLLYALIAFVVIDYITGVMCAVADKKLSITVGFKGYLVKIVFHTQSLKQVCSSQSLSSQSAGALMFSSRMMSP